MIWIKRAIPIKAIKFNQLNAFFFSDEKLNDLDNHKYAKSLRIKYFLLKCAFMFVQPYKKKNKQEFPTVLLQAFRRLKEAPGLDFIGYKRTKSTKYEGKRSKVATSGAPYLV